MDNPYKVIDPGVDATPEEITLLVNEQYQQGFDLVTAYLAGWKEREITETNSFLIFRKQVGK